MSTRVPLPLVLLGLMALAVAGCASSTAAGRSALNQGRPDQAAERFEEALAENPENVDALLGLGVSRYRLGDYPSAAANLEQALVRRPAEPGARLYLALVHLRLGNDAAAVEQLTTLRGLPLHPRFAVHVGRTIDLLGGPRLADPVRNYVAADLEDTAGWAREVAETRQALAHAQLWGDPFFSYGWHRPYYIRVHR
jgi:tetratricopeptide (TPR) repeat protein